jgi:RNA polymerase sigma-70 factor (ECF subfamily)
MFDPRSRVPPLTVVEGVRTPENATGRKQHSLNETPPPARDLEWSILMARAQDGDGEAYRRLLEAVTPYLRSLAAKWNHDPSDVEDAVQDILLTIHDIRQTYDPTRPLGPWLVTIAHRRLIDRLRRQGRLRSRETPLTAEHETIPAAQTNIEAEMSGRRELETALNSLPGRQRQAVQLLKLEEMSLKEAAAATDMSIAALKGAMHRALKNLRKMRFNRSEDS